MCNTPSKPKKIQPKAVQPPAIAEKAPEVNVGAQDEGATKRKKIGRSELRNPTVGTPSTPSGVGV